LATPRSRRSPAPRERIATHSVVSPRAADGCIARMMRKATGAMLTSDAALLLSQVVRLLVRHALSRRVAGGRTTAWPG
jgi:hypothetical protein